MTAFATKILIIKAKKRKKLMKTAYWNKITGLLCTAGLFAVLHFAHAQTTSDTGSAAMTDPDADVSNLSDLEVELKALEMVTPIAASNDVV